ncbi:MAG TPA: hypothetical protein VI172_05635 [Candidatus Dormibacteraeota bacterium]|jgi:hypothetical protein
MRKRRPEGLADLPPELDVFDVNDWWVTDPEDPLELQYARIRWAVARRAYLAGEDWQSHLGPPAWWKSPDP